MPEITPHNRSRYTLEIAKQFIALYVRLGTMEKACKAMNVGVRTINKWKNQYPEFARMLKHVRDNETGYPFNNPPIKTNTTMEESIKKYKVNIDQHLEAIFMKALYACTEATYRTVVIHYKRLYTTRGGKRVPIWEVDEYGNILLDKKGNPVQAREIIGETITTEQRVPDAKSREFVMRLGCDMEQFKRLFGDIDIQGITPQQIMLAIRPEQLAEIRKPLQIDYKTLAMGEGIDLDELNGNGNGDNGNGDGGH